MAESDYWNRFWRRRVSRRTILSAGAVTAAGLAGAAVVGCGGNGGSGNGNGDGGDAPEAIGSPTPGGGITQGRPFQALGIDPHIDLTGLDIDTLMYSYLYSFLPSVEKVVLNNLVEDMEIPDPQHFLFTLRKGVKVWPAPYGGPAADEDITSTDCKESFLRRGTALTAPDKRYPQRFLPENGGALDTPDPYTFNITLTEPFAPALQDMANPTWAIVPAKIIDGLKTGAIGASNLGQIAYGSGPFMLKEFRGHERIELVRHPNYFLNPRPWLETYRIIVITENSSLLAAFKSGQHDINGAILNKNDAEDLTKSDNYVVDKFPSLFYPCIHLKIRRPPFNDVRVREAINKGINRDEFLAVIFQGEGQYSGPIQWPQVKWALPEEELRAFYPYDTDKAKELLEEAGLKGGFTTKMKIPKLEGVSLIADMAVLLKDQLSRVGINIELDEVELGAFIANVILPGNFDMAFFPNLPYPEPDRPLSFYHSKGVTGTGNWTNYSNPDLDALIDAQAVEFDEAKRQEIILAAQRMILPEHGPQLTIAAGFTYLARWKHVSLGTVPGEYGQEAAGEAPWGADFWTTKK